MNGNPILVDDDDDDDDVGVEAIAEEPTDNEASVLEGEDEYIYTVKDLGGVSMDAEIVNNNANSGIVEPDGEVGVVEPDPIVDGYEGTIDAAHNINNDAINTITEGNDTNKVVSRIDISEDNAITSGRRQ